MEYKTSQDAEEGLKKLKKQKKLEIRQVKINARDEIQQIKKKYSYNPERYQAKLDRKRLREEEIKELRRQQALIPKRYTIGEEIFNSVSHGIGVGLSIAALVLMIVRAVTHGSPDRMGFGVTSVSIFGSSLIILYLMSTLYHALQPYHVKNVFQIFDHSSIYLLIAGSYTPFCLYGLGGALGWVVFGIIWGMAVTGITIYATMGNKMRLFSAITYIIMGWTIVFFFPAIKRAIPSISVTFLLLGGLGYTLGCPFYMLKKKRWTHSIFHLFCIAGSIMHFFSVYYMFE